MSMANLPVKNICDAAAGLSFEELTRIGEKVRAGDLGGNPAGDPAGVPAGDVDGISPYSPFLRAFCADLAGCVIILNGAPNAGKSTLHNRMKGLTKFNTEGEEAGFSDRVVTTEAEVADAGGGQSVDIPGQGSFVDRAATGILTASCLGGAKVVVVAADINDAKKEARVPVMALQHMLLAYGAGARDFILGVSKVDTVALEDALDAVTHLAAAYLAALQGVDPRFVRVGASSVAGGGAPTLRCVPFAIAPGGEVNLTAPSAEWGAARLPQTPLAVAIVAVARAVASPAAGLRPREFVALADGTAGEATPVAPVAPGRAAPEAVRATLRRPGASPAEFSVAFQGGRLTADLCGAKGASRAPALLLRRGDVLEVNPHGAGWPVRVVAKAVVVLKDRVVVGGRFVLAARGRPALRTLVCVTRVAVVGEDAEGKKALRTVLVAPAGEPVVLTLAAADAARPIPLAPGGLFVLMGTAVQLVVACGAALQ